MTPTPANPGAVTLYTTSWCGYCAVLRRGLRQAGIAYQEVDVDLDRDGARFVEGVNGGDRTVPTVLFPNGATMTNPSADEVAAALAGPT